MSARSVIWSCVCTLATQVGGSCLGVPGLPGAMAFDSPLGDEISGGEFRFREEFMPQQLAALAAELEAPLGPGPLPLLRSNDQFGLDLAAWAECINMGAVTPFLLCCVS